MRILNGLDLDVETGTSVVITGPSGSGKSTLLACLAGLIKPATGTVTVCGEEISTGLAGRRARLRRRHIGIVFQSGELLAELTPEENVALAALLDGVAADVAFACAAELLKALQVPLGRSTTGELSGGEYQRTAVARALVNSPSVVLADEPTGSLDVDLRDEVADVLFATPTADRALVVVTHDPAIAARADHVFRLNNGRLTPEVATKAAH